MKKIFSLFIILSILLYPIQIEAKNNYSPDISAKAAIVIDQDTGRILFEKNINKKLPMASTTKIMTLLLAIEKGNLKDIVTVSQKACSVGGSSIWLSPGEKIDLESLLYGLMLNSGNDAAVAIAEHIGGNLDNFIKMMNEKAKQIGALNTNFVTPSGLDIGIDNHYTTAYDLALITKYAFQYPLFSKIVSTKEKTIPWEGKEWNRYLRNKNKLLWIYEGADGVKTGYTNKAGRCLVSSATRNGYRFIAVVLNSNPMWEDSMKILDYCFSNYKPYEVLKKEEFIKIIPVRNGKQDNVEIVTLNGCTVPIKNEEINDIHIDVSLPEYVTAPINENEIVGKITIKIGDKKICEVPCKVNNKVEAKDYNFNFLKILRSWIY